MGEQEFIFNVAELNMISIACSQCKGSLTFDAGKITVNLPNKCPLCGADFLVESTFVGEYIRIYNRLKDAAHKVQFRARATQPARTC